MTIWSSRFLVTWTLVGAVLGGFIFGTLSDKFGRVRVLTLDYRAICSIYWPLCLCSRVLDLLIYRTIAGIGLGGEFGIGMALAAEAWPAQHRAKATSYVALGWQLGVLAAALLTPLLIPIIGWRGMFMVGIIPALVAWYSVRNYMNQKSLYKVKKIKSIHNTNSFKLLVKDVRTTKTSIGVAILTSVQNFGYYGIMIGYLIS